MKKTLMLSAATAALLLAGNGAAWAQGSCVGATSTNPNIIFVVGDSSTQTQIGEISFSGSSGNGFADITVITTTQCLATNTQSGNPVPGQNQFVQTEETLQDVKVCQNVGGSGGPFSEPVEGFDVDCTIP